VRVENNSLVIPEKVTEERRSISENHPEIGVNIILYYFDV